MAQLEPGPTELTREECLALLPTVPVGRIVFTARALPAVVPVNFVVDHDRIVVRTGTGSTLDSALRDGVVAFEVDDFDVGVRNGWTVTVTGRVRHVVDDLERQRLAALPLIPFAGDLREEFLVLPIELVVGRRVGDGPLAHAR